MAYQLQNITQDIIVADFDCGDADLNDYLKNDALHYAKEWISATHILCYETHPVGFFTLIWDSLQRDRIADNDRLPCYPYAKYPVIKLARLAVDLPYQNQGVGTELMISFFKIAKRAVNYGGGRFLTVDAKKSAVGFYKKFGFVEVKSKTGMDTVPMYLDFYSFVRESE